MLEFFSKNSNFSTSNYENQKYLPQLSSSSYSTNSNSRANNVRKMTFEELQERRRNGLCYSCPKKWVKGLVCPNQQLLLLDVFVDECCDVDCEIQEGQQFEITNCAVYGTSAPQHSQTMKVFRFIKNCYVIILFDLGSSHNFISLLVAKKLGWKVDVNKSFEVMIANGVTITSKSCVLK